MSAPSFASEKSAPVSVSWTNPIIRHRADPWVMRQGDSYYFTATVPAYDLIEIRRADSLAGLGAATPSVIWRKPATGPASHHIWAPELHHIDGKWYVYFAAGRADAIWAIRIYVLECTSDDPLAGPWIERGQLDTGLDSFALDATTFTHRGIRYLIWAQHDPAIGGNTNLYISRMSTPWSISGGKTLITKPEFDWEIKGHRVNEGPAVLIRNGRVFLTYSASATDANYCLGLLTADENADLLNAASWKKSPVPVLASSDSARVFGPGHNSFTTLPDGRDVLVYHARDYRDIAGDPLNNPDRHTRASIINWNPDGNPSFSYDPVLASDKQELTSSTASPDTTLKIEPFVPVRNVSPIHYGLMTEEINFSYDGGLYAELVRNRAFEDDTAKPVHWSAVSGATLALDTANTLNSIRTTSLRLSIHAAGDGVSNSGYWGIPIKPATRYRATIHAKAAAGFTGRITVSLQSADGTTTYARAESSPLAQDWNAHELILTTTSHVAPTTRARLAITFREPGTVWLGFVSLFPPTWNNRPNGLRPDLMQMLVDLKPAFLRFPGGNYLEGERIETRFKWWETLGPVALRPGHPGPWGYRSTDGMGLLEFLLWCKDMGAEPVLGLYAGYSLNGSYVKPGPDLQPFVQEALDEIEYVTGPVTSFWGARRAQDGHPEPFKLRYVEIGNEDWFDKSGSYDARYAQFHDAIKARYPALKCISSVGNEQPAEKRVHSRTPDVLDEHYYRNTESFLKTSHTHFDDYDRKGPEIFVGEWAAHETAFPPWDKRSKSLAPTPNMTAAIGDAAFMAAMERNSDLVTMQCYAPLFANVNDYQWRPNLIGYDALRSFGAPSYHAFRLFSTKVGDQIMKTSLTGDTSLHQSVTRDSKSGVMFVKLVNPLPQARTVRIDCAGLDAAAHAVRVSTLSAAPDDTNSISDPAKVVPVTSVINVTETPFKVTVVPTSITVLQINTR